jgi:hypothetical protein
MPGSDFRWLRGQGFVFQSGAEVGFGFCRRDVPDQFEQAAIAEPIQPFQRLVFHGLEAAPRAATVNDFSLETVVDRLDERVVVAVADAAHRGLYPCFGQALGATSDMRRYDPSRATSAEWPLKVTNGKTKLQAK